MLLWNSDTSKGWCVPSYSASFGQEGLCQRCIGGESQEKEDYVSSYLSFILRSFCMENVLDQLCRLTLAQEDC